MSHKLITNVMRNPSLGAYSPDAQTCMCLLTSVILVQGAEMRGAQPVTYTPPRPAINQPQFSQGTYNVGHRVLLLIKCVKILLCGV